MASKSINTILNLRDNFSKTINKTTSKTQQFQRRVKQAENQVNRMKSGISGAFGGVALKIGGALAGLGIATFAKDSLMLASNLKEVQNVVDTTFGKMSKNVNSFAIKAAKQFGMSELQAKQFSGTLGAMMKSSGISGNQLTKMSTNLAGLAGDFASFYNLEPAEAFEKIKAAMVGSTEPMLSLGINMSVASMSAYALSKGIKKSWEKMSEAEKQTLRYNYLLEKSKDAQGDYAKTHTGFANGLRTVQIRIKDVGAKIMSYAIPSFEKLWAVMIKFIDGLNVDAFMNKLIALGKTGFDKLTKAVSWLKNNMDWLIPVVGGLLSTFVAFSIITKVVSMFMALKKAVQAFTTVQALLNTTMLANPIFWIAIAIGALVGIFIYAYKHCEKFRNGVNSLFAKFVEFGKSLMSYIQPILNQISTYFTTTILPILVKVGALLKMLWDNFLKPIANFMITVWVAEFQIAFETVKNVVKIFVDTIGQWVGGVIRTFSGIVDFLTGVFTGDWEMAWNGIKDIFGGIWDSLTALIKFPINMAIEGINTLIRGFNKLASFNLPGIGTIGIQIPEIPKFALGTQYFKGGLAQTDERGGEIKEYPNGTKIIPADKSKKIIKNMGGHTFNFYFNGNVGTEEFFEEAGGFIVRKVQVALANM